MQPISILLPQDSRRDDAEDLIRRAFLVRYDARVSIFPELIAALLDPAGRPICAAALRFAKDGFFSEQYLSVPAEETLSRAYGCHVARQQIFEVTSLASVDHHRTADFIRGIVGYGQAIGQEWSFFTLTHRLWQMLVRMGFHSTFLANAERDRVANASDWGTYYMHSPAVFGVRNPAHAPQTPPRIGSTHAVSF